jgi:hypothetical protein
MTTHRLRLGLQHRCFWDIMELGDALIPGFIPSDYTQSKMRTTFNVELVVIERVYMPVSLMVRDRTRHWLP